MTISAIKGILHKGKIKPLENISYKGEKEVIIIFLDKTKKNDEIWDEYVAKDFLGGYSKKDISYDKL